MAGKFKEPNCLYYIEKVLDIGSNISLSFSNCCVPVLAISD